jgi:hypothetical protein
MQYPHFLFVKNVTDSVQDDVGNWSDSSEQWVLHSVCREQTNGKGSVVYGQDGKAIVFSSVIHLPLESEKISEGTQVIVSNSDNVSESRISGDVIKYDVGQLHCRLWL